MTRAVRRPGVREGYDLWASSYDTTRNPLVALDRRLTLAALAPRAGERILDAGCGTGYYLSKIGAAGARCVGSDLSRGMMLRARAIHPDAVLVESDLDAPFPFRSESFDAVLSALVSEHITGIGGFCREVARVLRPGGRFVWSVFHPDLASRGTEANFVDEEGCEVRLGAERHTIEDYRQAIDASGLVVDTEEVVAGDEALARAMDRAKKYVGQPMLIVYAAVRP